LTASFRANHGNSPKRSNKATETRKASAGRDDDG
jgi:hypothetical protein